MPGGGANDRRGEDKSHALPVPLLGWEVADYGMDGGRMRTSQLAKYNGAGDHLVPDTQFQFGP